MRYFLLTISFIMMIMKLVKIDLNKRQRNKGITEELSLYYTNLQYKRWMKYEKKRDIFFRVKIVFTFCLNCFFYLSSFYFFIYKMLPRDIVLNSIGMIMIVNGIESCVYFIFDYYYHFHLEAKYHMNKMILKTFILDEVKDFIIDSILIVIVILFVHCIYLYLDIYGLTIVGICGVIVVYIIQNKSLFVLRLYNEFVPLKDGELKKKIMELVHNNGFQLKGIYVMDASKRTKRANAFCLGDKEKEICIDDNMLKYYSEDEILSVFAHELGHAVYNHSQHIKKFLYLRMLLLFFIVVIVFLDSQLYVEFGIDNLNYCMIMVLLNVFIDPMMFLLSIPYNQLLRKDELEADRFALKQGYGNELKNILIKLTGNSLSDINPHPFIVMLTYTHPTLVERIKNIEEN